MIEPRTLKGFRDFLPQEARKRQYVINKLKQVFESFGFEPLETPTLEYEEILAGKYGEEGDKLMYRFEDNGKRRVAMRYDQTVPLARVVAQYQNELPMPFKRYQIQPVWRAENTQKGRYREFIQCDIDTVGSNSILSDAEILVLIARAYEKLGFTKSKILINDRTVFSRLVDDKGIVTDENLPVIIRALDKLKKIGREGVIDELVQQGFPSDYSVYLLQTFETIKPTEYIEQLLSCVEQLGGNKERYEFLPTLARGLDYYTKLIIEVEIDGYTVGSVGGGGRYDNLIGMFTKQQVPAVGFAFGFDRIIEAMEEQNLFPTDLQTTQVLVTIFSPDLQNRSRKISSEFRSGKINTELYLDENAKMEKQLKYADKKGIPYVIVIGPEEAEKNVINLKNMQTREQKTMTLEEALALLQ